MKTFSFITLFCSAFAFAQQGPAYSGDYVNYTHTVKDEKIALQLPKGSEIKPDGKLVINGRTYSIEVTNALPYLEKSSKGKEKDMTEEKRQIYILSYFTATKGVRPLNIDDENTSNHRMKYTQDKELVNTYYGFNKHSEHEMVENLGGAKVVGDNLLIISMDEKIDPQGDEILQNEDMLFNVLDSATLVTGKTDKKPM